SLRALCRNRRRSGHRIGPRRTRSVLGGASWPRTLHGAASKRTARHSALPAGRRPRRTWRELLHGHCGHLPALSEPKGLPRRIGIGGALLLAFNGAIGASIFALPATLAADFGTLAPWLFPIIGIASLLIAIPFSRSVAAFPESGGRARHGRVFGSLAGFELGWIYYVARATAFAANLNVLVSYVARWWTGADAGASRIAAMLVLVGAFTAVNISG